MSIREQKAQIVEELKISYKASSAILVDYKGLNVQEATELRSSFREAGVTTRYTRTL